MDYTIDTSILGKASKIEYDSIEVMNRIKRNSDLIVLDCAGKIEEEYRDCIGKAKVGGRIGYIEVAKWLKYLGDFNRIHYVEGDLTHKQQTKLTRLNFHDDDIPFVNSCYFSFSKKIITADSDYDGECNSYLISELGLTILKPDEFLQNP
jgi:hypothetical protein